MQETQVQSLDWEDPLGKGMATHPIRAWRIPWTEEPGRLAVHLVSQRVGHKSVTNTHELKSFRRGLDVSLLTFHAPNGSSDATVCDLPFLSSVFTP